MHLDEIQTYVADLLEAFPAFAAAGVAVLVDDGTYPKLTGLQEALNGKGFVLIVWEVGCYGITDVSKTGGVSMMLSIHVVIQEIVKQNTSINGTQISSKRAIEHVLQAVGGYPRHTPPGTPIIPHHDPFETMGTVNGVRTAVVNFTKLHRITPDATGGVEPVNVAGANYRFKDGQFQIFDATAHQWRSVGIVDGQIILGNPQA